MTLTTTQQFIKLIKASNNILLLFKDIDNGIGYPAGADAIASSLALYQILKKNGKSVDIVSPNFKPSKSFLFLEAIENIKDELELNKKLKISIDISKSGLKKLSHDIKMDKLNIYLEPQKNNINIKSLKHELPKHKHDLIITLDTPNLVLLKKFYTDNKKMFDSVPIINIDNNPHNEYYGEINIVNIKKSSVTEVLWEIIKDSKNLNKKIINCILAGIIAKTKNFKKQTINSETLDLVSKLIALGATRADIVDNFYKNKNIEQLKLWGRTLARLKYNKNITWSLLTNTDFIHCGTKEESLPELIHELISTHNASDIIVLLYETNNKKIKALLYSEKTAIEIKELDINHTPEIITKLSLPYSGLIEAEKNFIPKIKESYN